MYLKIVIKNRIESVDEGLVLEILIGLIKFTDIFIKFTKVVVPSVQRYCERMRDKVCLVEKRKTFNKINSTLINPRYQEKTKDNIVRYS